MKRRIYINFTKAAYKSISSFHRFPTVKDLYVSHQKHAGPTEGLDLQSGILARPEYEAPRWAKIEPWTESNSFIYWNRLENHRIKQLHLLKPLRESPNQTASLNQTSSLNEAALVNERESPNQTASLNQTTSLNEVALVNERESPNETASVNHTTSL